MLGTTLSSRYKIVKHLGGGGFGQTFLAEDLQLPGDPLCVVKQLKPKATDPFTLETARRLFDREAHVLYQLGNHDRIPRLLAHFEQDNEFYLAQELIEGHDLKQELPFGKVLSQTQVIALLQEILEILEFVHQQNVIHRDIKPSNLIRRKQDGKIVLIDFGAVKQVGTQTVNSEQGAKDTALTVAIGSPGYMPNEQLKGKPRFCSDIYAVGMIGIQALTGLPPDRLPEDAQTSEIIWRDRCNTLGEPMQANLDLADVIDKMVRSDYRQRYQTAAEALQALQLVNRDRSPQQSPPLTQTLPTPAAPPQATVTATLPRPTSPSPEETIPGSAVNSAASQITSQTTPASVSTIPRPSRRLIGISAGIATVLALTVGIYYGHAQYISIAQSQWAEKISLAKTLTADSNYVNPVAISPDGKMLASGGDDGAIRLWDLKTGELKNTLKGHSSAVVAIAISKDGQILASGSADETVKIWNLSTGQQIRTLSGDSKGIRSIAISPDTQTIVSGDALGKIEIWSVSSGERLNVLEGHEIWVTSLAISADGPTLASSSTDKTTKLWELKTGALLHTLTEDNSKPVLSVAINPNGQTVASGDVGGTIKLWDLQSGKLIRTLIAGLGAIESLAISPNGQTLLSGGGNGAIRLWNLQTGKPMRTLSGHSDSVNSLAMSPDGQTLVSSSQDKTIRIWRSP